MKAIQCVHVQSWLAVCVWRMAGPLMYQLFGKLAVFVQEQSDFGQMWPHQVKIKLLQTLKSIWKVNCAQYQINNIKTGAGD